MFKITKKLMQKKLFQIMNVYKRKRDHISDPFSKNIGYLNIQII